MTTIENMNEKTTAKIMKRKTPKPKNPRAPIALMACESGREFAESVASQMGTRLLPTNETWFACGEG